MKKILLTFLTIGSFAAANAQVAYVDDFANGADGSGGAFWGTGAAEMTAIKHDAGGVVTVTRTEGTNNYISIAMQFYNNPVQCAGPCAESPASGQQIGSIDMSAGATQDTIFIIAKAGTSGASLRLDIKDAAGVVSNANAVIKTLTDEFALYKYAYTGTISGNSYPAPDYTETPGNVDKATIAELGFYLQAGVAFGSGDSETFTIDYIQIGGNSENIEVLAAGGGGDTSSVVASTNSALAAKIASSKIYPNPVSDFAKVELNLKSASSVKVTLSDLMGKEIMTIAEGTFAELSREFSVANLNKGMYNVTYLIDGKAAKAEMLMVK